ncbi:hypothetical protein Gpo141_00008896 [Globisporangium polare]
MYQSALDPLGKLTFPFDPLRALHAREDSELQWPEFPYKQVLIDRVRSKSATAGGSGSTTQKLSVEAAAGALLMALGQETGAHFEVEQHRLRDHDDDNEYRDATSASGWRQLESRFTVERAAFQAAKRAYLQQQKQKVHSQLASIDARKRADEEQEAHEAWRQRQIVKRYEDGSKYDGDGMRVSNVFVPHGHGTLWVPQKKQFVAVGDIKRVPQYVGAWMDGFMHGQGTYFWDSRDSWTGSFLRDEMEGKGVYTFKDDGHHDDDTDGEQLTGRTAKNPSVRYYSASQHVCWGHELVRGCRLMLFGNRHYGHALASVLKRCDVDLEQETEVVLVTYNETNDTHLVRKCGTEDTRWISLHNTNFRVLAGKPIARLEND